MDNQTPHELLAVIEQQLKVFERQLEVFGQHFTSIKSSVQELKRRLQGDSIAQSVRPQSNGRHSMPVNRSAIGNENDANVSNDRKVGRKRKSIPESELNFVSQPKQIRRHSIHSHGTRLNLRQDNAQVLENSVPSTTVKSAKIVKKRSLNLRKSIGQELSDTPVPPNTNHEMYATNALYRTLCLYCQTAEKYLVAHYIKKHPQHEVPIARVSPEMADRFRTNNVVQKFHLNMGKIEAFCPLCEETKAMPKHHWTIHFLHHTGEQMFHCDTCNKKFKHKNDHVHCTGPVMNVFDRNSSDSSLMGYMCKDCNYIQFHLSSMEKHVMTEHHESDVQSHYDKVVLIPNMTPLRSDISARYSFAEASKRFKCTVCQTQMLDAEAFTAHFTDVHCDVNQYECFCGEIVPRNDQIPGNQWVAAHLLMHRTDLHQCMICMGVFLRKKDVRNHIFKTHRSNHPAIQYQHICRNLQLDLKRHTKISETTVQRLKCNICQYQANGTFAQILHHFESEHPTTEIEMIGISCKKVTNLARIPSDAETTFECGYKVHIR